MFRSQRTVVSCVDCICYDRKKICNTVDFSLVKRMNLCDNKVTKNNNSINRTSNYGGSQNEKS